MTSAPELPSSGQPEGTRPVTLVEALIPVVSLIVLISLSFFLFGDEGALGPNQIALVVATMVAVLIGWRCGHTLEPLGEAAVESVSSGIGAIFILFAVGSLIGTWAMSGTLIAMVYYGLEILSPNYFYLTAAVLCGVISMSIGSSWTVVGTIGIGLMGIAANMGLSPAVTAGAVISGAYLGDKSSPLSDSANLAAAAAGVDLYQHVRETLVTSVVTLPLALVVFWFLGSPGDFDASEKISAITRFFNISLVLFLPLVVVVVLALLKIPPFTTIFIGALLGGVMAVIMAPDRVVSFAAGEGLPRPLALLKGVWLALASGYKASTGDARIDQLVSRGGMESMLNTIWLVIAALAFGGVVEKAGALERLIDPVIRVAKSVGTLVASLVAAVLGVATWHYLPYAVFNIASPLLAIAIAATGLRVLHTAPVREGRAPHAPVAGDG